MKMFFFPCLLLIQSRSLSVFTQKFIGPLFLIPALSEKCGEAPIKRLDVRNNLVHS